MQEGGTRARPSFVTALLAERGRGKVPVIPDLKVRSPKEGQLIAGDPVDLAQALVTAGAPALSVVTEGKEFAGSVDMLARVARNVNVPVLRKDFIRDPRDIQVTYEAGASAVLLIVAQLSRDELVALHDKAHQVGLETLIEVHNQQELEMVKGLRLDALGINNRDILQLELDSGTVSTTEQLASGVPPGTVLVSESGITSTDDVRRAMRAGATAVLVGTAILRAQDPTECLRAFRSAWDGE